MCQFPNGEINFEYLRDLKRGRHSDPNRFYILRDYARARWDKSRELHHARRWLIVMDSIKRRAPVWMNSNYGVGNLRTD